MERDPASGDVGDAVDELKRREGRDIVTYGSAGLMATLMERDLVDEYRIGVHPFVILVYRPL